jgi:hypothetical protein
VFPDCSSPEEIRSSIPDYKKNNFPATRELQVRVLAGNHASPELSYQLFADAVLQLMMQK